jgi:hypothetical protein
MSWHDRRLTEPAFRLERRDSLVSSARPSGRSLFLQLLQVVEHLLIGAGLTFLLVMLLAYLHSAGMNGAAHPDGGLTRDLMSAAIGAVLLAGISHALVHYWRSCEPNVTEARKG